MLKTKHALSALALLAAMTMATSAFAQGVFTVSSSIEPRARLNGQTEGAGGITLSLTSGTIGTGVGDNGTVTIDYGTMVTNGIGTGQIVIDICGETGATTGADANTTISGSTITLTVDDANGCSGDVSIDVSGVRLAIAGQGLSDVSANITSSGMVRLAAGANQVPVINSVVDELVDGGVTSDKVTLIRHTADPEDNEYFKLLIEENAVDSFGKGDSDNVELNLDFSGIGTGMSVKIDAWLTTKDALDDLEPTMFLFDRAAGPGGTPAAFTCDADGTTTADDATDDCVTTNKQLAFDGGMNSDSLEVTLTSRNSAAVVKMGLGDAVTDADDGTDGIQVSAGGSNVNVTGGTLDRTKIDVVVIRGMITVDTRPPPPAVALPLGDVNIAATVDVGPTGSAACRGPACNVIPRFASDESAAVTVIDVTSDQTMLRVPYAVATGDLWDTGIAIANTQTGSAAQFGAVTFDFYGGDVEIDSYTTMAGSPGNGLNDDGMLEAGGTYSVLLSAVLEAAGHDGDFTGYVVVTTDFTNAEAYVFIASFVGGAWGASGMVEDITP